MARAAGGDPDPAWGVRIHPATAEAPFVLADDGIGLAAGEIEDLLATVGRRLQARHARPAPRRLSGPFRHRPAEPASWWPMRFASSATRPVTAPWCGPGAPTAPTPSRSLSDVQTEAIDIGTRVTLAPSAERIALLGERRVRELATEYGEFLPLPVSVGAHDGPITSLTTAPPFLPGGDREAALAYGETLLGHRPLDVIDLTIRATGTTGVAYVLAKPLAGRGHRGARVYLGRMLLNADEQAIVPEWGFFLLPVVTSDHLTPTASREQLVKDDAVDTTRDGIAAAFRAWVKRVATTNRPLLDAFLRAHDQAIRAACVDDEQAPSRARPLPHVRDDGGGAHPRVDRVCGRTRALRLGPRRVPHAGRHACPRHPGQRRLHAPRGGAARRPASLQ
ncbi:hypothetical protein [Demequina litorisediminis]|uniref:Uncharacterized protein n=1 Tax=Demequina litorisediminis TaxID=1849022 RepID=A0ABQ6ID36_9MICO|nr:hypothetical protein [Demequina litorisediminis]GMA35316.1 hypothetical protein GCM10025876_15200 [Demequina litorisediminis]